MKLRTWIISLVAILIAAGLLTACGAGKSATPTPTLKITPSPQISPKPTLAPLPEMDKYSDNTFGYSIDYPLEWNIERTVINQFRASSLAMVSGKSEFGNNESGIVVTIDNSKYPENVTMEIYYQGFLASARQSKDIIDLIEESAAEVQFGQHISGYESTWLVTDSAGQWKLKWYIANAREQYYMICVYAVAGAFDKYAPMLDSAINSFTFIEIQTPPAGGNSVIPAPK
jgi:hypothetical protein